MVLKELRDHYNYMKNGGVARNTLGYSIQYVASVIYVWFNADEWKTIPWTSKFLNALYIAINYSCLLLLLFTIAMNELTLETVPVVARTLSLFIGGFVTANKMVNYCVNREALTTFLRDLNEAVQESVRISSPERQQAHQRLSVMALRLTILSSGFLALYCLTVVGYAMVLGSHFMDFWLPMERGSYSGPWYGVLIIGQIWLWTSSGIYETQEVLCLDSIFQLSFCYQTLYEKLSKVGQLGEEGDRALIGWATRTYTHFNGLTVRLCEILWLPNTLMWLSAYIILGLGLVAITMTAHMGVLVNMSNLLYPVYVLASISVSAAFGQYFEEEANKLNETIFNSDWTEMSVSNRKMLITQMIVGQERLTLYLPPFVVINLSTLGDVLRRTYSLYAVARNMFN